MTYENILYGVDERVCTISLNRPEKMNALSWALRLELRDALKRAERDQDVGCIVIKGEGRAFSAGYDLTPTQPSPNRPVEGYVSEDVDQLTAQYARDLVNGLWLIWELTQAGRRAGARLVSRRGERAGLDVRHHVRRRGRATRGTRRSGR